MQGLRAFVGHSFLERDERLVQKFLGYLNTLTKAHLGFSWDHALAAEPLPLHEKVLAKIADKNVFIGICTKGERAVRNEALSPILFRPARLAGAAVDFHWKTS